ncbi:MAG: hypothetical protein A2091_12020 [Desulfuromonadales bacterium GWD2_61_12]|nr:MAG: hypothetical protein A2005_09060 [Desulfuromonadales bacterium GWC2_61_20]OGR34768.1 MAG: hypothetical protein A2091_12020 [Desulfuromonadales bacterium GWD2_61_12]HAD04877.1 hypothetical protein [Desulfuromonas sp.]HBT83634.1 hypothetical protein [Desulfuromonas sp.]
MIIPVKCPHCKQDLPLLSHNIWRDQTIACPQCFGQISISGRFLSEIFWVSNTYQREQSL